MFTLSGDGNSLCHAVSILIYGVPDQKLTIRRLLHQTCIMHLEERSPLYDRWSQFMKKLCNELGREYNIVVSGSSFKGGVHCFSIQVVMNKLVISPKL